MVKSYKQKRPAMGGDEVKETLVHWNYLNSIIVLIWWCHLALGIGLCE
jgi:hypothetical protein